MPPCPPFLGHVTGQLHEGIGSPTFCLHQLPHRHGNTRTRQTQSDHLRTEKRMNRCITQFFCFGQSHITQSGFREVNGIIYLGLRLFTVTMKLSTGSHNSVIYSRRYPKVSGTVLGLIAKWRCQQFMSPTTNYTKTKWSNMHSESHLCRFTLWTRKVAFFKYSALEKREFF